jgi:predicted O-methyltransferase YrrM
MDMDRSTTSPRSPSPSAEQDLEYLEQAHPGLDGVVAEMLAAGRAEGIPIVQLPVARFLHVLVAGLRADRIVEIGTAIGFSTLWMATALPAGGRIDTIDPDRSRTDRARRFWIRAQVGDRIRVTNEPALRVLPRLAAGIDLAFVDAVKTEYSAYLEALLPKMRSGGVILADNLLWSGRIASGDRDADTDALRAFNETFLHHPQLRSTILPVGDGLGFAVVT